MKLGFGESQSAYASGSQSARAWTEAWVSTWAYCPHCGNAKISSFPNNSPLADFFCASCNEEFELKSQKGKFGTSVVDGAFKTKCPRDHRGTKAARRHRAARGLGRVEYPAQPRPGIR